MKYSTRILSLTILFGAAGAAVAAVAAGSAAAQDAISAPAQKTVGAHSQQMVPSLAVINSGGASLADGKLTMTNFGPSTIVFADRPVRAAGHVPTAQFIGQWDEGKDSFAKDPPNATISVFGRDGQSVQDAVVVLKAPKLEGNVLTFDVSVLEGEIAGADGPASLFIDWFAARGPHGGAVVAGGGWRHAPVWHGGWYAHPAYYGAGVAAGAAIGAAAVAARPYYYAPPPPCGYYPYPPCY